VQHDLLSPKTVYVAVKIFYILKFRHVALLSLRRRTPKFIHSICLPNQTAFDGSFAFIFAPLISYDCQTMRKFGFYALVLALLGTVPSCKRRGSTPIPPSESVIISSGTIGEGGALS